MKAIAAIALVLVTCNLSRSQIVRVKAPQPRSDRYYIPVGNRVSLASGAPPGTCMWQCWETLAGKKYRSQVAGMAADRARRGIPMGRPEYAVEELTKRKVSFSISGYRVYDRAALYRHARTGAVVGVYARGSNGKKVLDSSGLPMGHAIVVVGFVPAQPSLDRTPNKVIIWDPSNSRSLHPTNCLGSIPGRQFFGNPGNPYSGNWLGNSGTVQRNGWGNGRR